MAVYIITTESFPNGFAATQRIKCYAKALADNGNECEVICVNRFEDNDNPMGNTYASSTIDGYSYRYIGGSSIKSINQMSALFDRAFDTLRLVFFLLKLKSTDKIIYYSYNRLLIKLVLAIAGLKHFKTFYEINEHPSIQLGRIRIDEDNPQHLRKLFNFLSHFDGFLCISTAIKELLVKSGLPANKMHIVNIIVDGNRFTGLKKENVSPFIAYCGAADNNKDGVDQLIKSFALISSNFPDVRLYIIGPIRKDVQNIQLAKDLGIENKVVFTGMVSSEKLPQILKNANILALDRPDGIQAKYGFPTKLGEYLLSGNPVVITDVGDISLFLKDRESAFISLPDSVDSFANKLYEALNVPENAKNIGQKGKMIGETYFSLSFVKKQLCEAMGLSIRVKSDIH